MVILCPNYLSFFGIDLVWQTLNSLWYSHITETSIEDWPLSLSHLICKTLYLMFVSTSDGGRTVDGLLLLGFALHLLLMLAITSINYQYQKDWGNTNVNNCFPVWMVRGDCAWHRPWSCYHVSLWHWNLNCIWKMLNNLLPMKKMEEIASNVRSVLATVSKSSWYCIMCSTIFCLNPSHKTFTIN